MLSPNLHKRTFVVEYYKNGQTASVTFADSAEVVKANTRKFLSCCESGAATVYASEVDHTTQTISERMIALYVKYPQNKIAQEMCIG